MSVAVDVADLHVQHPSETFEIDGRLPSTGSIAEADAQARVHAERLDDVGQAILVQDLPAPRCVPSSQR
jgi:hypothetical protein